MRFAPLMEIFSSIQGEGAYLGEPQIFVRFARCPLRCLYCDTPGSWTVKEKYRVFGRGRSSLHSNPASVPQILRHCRALERPLGRPLTVSLTGGEPLLYPDFLLDLSTALRREGRRVHLETAGVHPLGLKKILSQIDHVSMDWKLGSTLESGDFLETQKRFLKTALEAKIPDVAVKIVVTPGVSEKEFQSAIEAVYRIHPQVAVIVQPATPKRKIKKPVSARKLQGFTRIAMSRLESVRVLPQLHPVLGLR